MTVMDVIFDFAQRAHDLLMCPAFDGSPQIDADDLTQHTGVDTLGIVNWKCHSCLREISISRNIQRILAPGLDVLQRLMAEVSVIQFCIVATTGGQCIMVTLFNDLPVAQNNDSVSGFNRRESVSDH